MSRPTEGNARRTHTRGWLSRERSLALALIIASAIVFYLCYRMVEPFLPSLAWALALAVVAHPLHRWILKRVRQPNVAAFLAVAIVALLIVSPVVFVTERLVREAAAATRLLQDKRTWERFHAFGERNPRLRPLVGWAEDQLAIESGEPPADEPAAEDGDETSADKDKETAVLSREQGDDDDRGASAPPKPAPAQPSAATAAQQAGGFVARQAASVASGTAWAAVQLLITLFALFFFFRDRRPALESLRSFMPLSDEETDEVFSRVDDTIHATLYGSLVVAIVQGTLGGLMFWWLDLPAPMVWGAVMAILATVPVLGTFVIWAPTAIFLALEGSWGKALILAVWGGIAIAFVDNLLYPFLVGKRLRRHTLLIFFSLIGGLALFGASGVILGPVLLAVADALIHIWRRRTALGQTVEDGVNG